MKEKRSESKVIEHIFLAIVIIVFGSLTLSGLSSEYQINSMIEDSKKVEEAAKEYLSRTGDWPINNNEVSLPDNLLGSENELANIDEKELMENGILGSLDSESDDFGIIISGPHEGKTIFLGNNGEGILKINGSRIYGENLVFKGNPAFQPIIPVPVFMLKKLIN